MASRPTAARFIKRETIIIDDTDDVTTETFVPAKTEADDDIIRKFNLIDLTEDDGANGPDYIREITPKFAEDASPNLPFGHSHLESAVTVLGAMIVPNDCVELVDGDFLCIKRIVRKNIVRETILEGILFRRTRRVDDMLPKKYNEVCMILKADISNGTQPRTDDCLVSRPLDAVSVVREIICTNRPFPALSFREAGKDHYDYELVQETAVLVCRWKYLEFFDRARLKVMEQMLVRLREDESGLGIPDAQLAHIWRGGKTETLTKGAKLPNNFVDLTGDGVSPVKGKKRARVDVDLTMDVEEKYEEEMVETSIFSKLRRISHDRVTERQYKSSSTITKRRTIASDSRSSFSISNSSNSSSNSGTSPKTIIRRHGIQSRIYTYGDICAGAGGTASGAAQSGLSLSFLLDHWDDACSTLGANFSASGTKILSMDIHDFCTGALYRAYYKVDVLHISFPCQPHSCAHTKEGKNDDANIASGYSVIPILEKCKPRIVTFEQTSCIVTHRGGWHFRALIHQLTTAGYSARWKIVNAAEFGVVQKRKRLIIIAAGPGEVLPPFPSPTHGISRNLKPFTTIRDVLACVPKVIDPYMMQHTARPHGIRYDASQPLRRAVTTNGGASNLHPSGTRSFNLQELAQCQGFPPKHEFVGSMTSIRKQIGNAVPSCFMKTLFEGIKSSLEESDRNGQGWKPEVIEVD